jgi:hypothetical protein
MSERPTKLKIGSFDYTVEWMDRNWSDQENAFGACHRDTCSIKIAEHATPHRIAGTFVHEVFHALQEHFMGPKGEIDIEQASHIAGDGLVMFWRDNPEAFEWWSSLL